MTIPWQSSVLIGIATTLAVIAAASSAPAYTMTQERSMAVTDYLTKFGYINFPTSGNVHSLLHGSSLTEAIKDFQGFFGLTVNGFMDDETLEVMAKPRCGFRDRNNIYSNSRSKRYALDRNSWPVKDLTYKITKYSKHLSRQEVDSEIERAFAVWSDYTDLTFTAKDRGSVHIKISFVEGDHGDGDAFDGPQGVLAHANSPSRNSHAHFDDAEHWTVNSYNGESLFQTAAHEFGHSLGLLHSKVKSALMYAIKQQNNPNVRLHSDDVQGIQALYGEKTNRKRGPTSGGSNPRAPQRPTPKPRRRPTCRNPKGRRNKEAYSSEEYSSSSSEESSYYSSEESSSYSSEESSEPSGQYYYIYY